MQRLRKYQMRVKWQHLVEIRVNKPYDWLELKLTPSELNTLRQIGNSYDSADILWNAWDEDRQAIPIGDVAWAFIATAGDGGDIGTVPLVGGPLLWKIDRLFDVVDNATIRDIAELYADQDGADKEQAKRLIPFRYRFFGD